MEIIAALSRIALDTEQTALEFGNEVEHLPASERLTYVRLNTTGPVTGVRLQEWEHFDRLTAATNDYLNRHRKIIEECAALVSRSLSE